jgi:hypothetical protein
MPQSAFVTSEGERYQRVQRVSPALIGSNDKLSRQITDLVNSIQILELTGGAQAGEVRRV